MYRTLHSKAYKKDSLVIPDLRSIMLVEKIIGMQNWIFDEFIKDAAENPNCCELSESIEVSNERELFIIRNTSRVLSYVNQSSLIEGLLSKAYVDMCV